MLLKELWPDTYQELNVSLNQYRYQVTNLQYLLAGIN